MNTTGLTRLYDRLTVWERIPLLVAANARGDDAEHGRLFAASPIEMWRIPAHVMAELGLHVLAMMYIGEQLDAAANVFFALCKVKDASDPQPQDWLLMAEACAYFFAANAEAWRRLGEELGIASDALTAGNHRGQFLAFCEAHMPANALTAEALQARFRESGRDVPKLVTSEDLLTSWRSLLQEMSWHGPRGR
jgi:hypothetical protein